MKEENVERHNLLLNLFSFGAELIEKINNMTEERLMRERNLEKSENRSEESIVLIRHKTILSF